MESYLQSVINYTSLGYEITLISLYGKDAIRMRKAYSYKAERPLICEQVIHYEELQDEEQRAKIFEFLYNDIQEQEKSGKYKESVQIN